MIEAVYFDMDDTLYGLTTLPDWLPRLRAKDARVYRDGKPCHDMRKIARAIANLQKVGVPCGIISWLSKVPDPKLYRESRIEKRRFLQKHLPSVVWDEIHITAYGRAKSYIAKHPKGLLIDDNAEVRAHWEQCGGITLDPTIFTTDELVDRIYALVALG